jgi:cytochrome oxidase Cu insertion factor (SCO1/SenC/PrrC family)
MAFGDTIAQTVLGKPTTPEDTDNNPNTIAEGAAVNTTVGITAHSTFANGNASLDYSLSADSSGGGFKIDQSTGVVTVADPSKIDFESAPGHVYTITVLASKNNNFSSEQTFTIGVTDIAPSAPVDSNAAANTVLEGAANGTTVGITASSTDVNGGAVTYALTGDTSAGGFTVNAITGVVSVADGSKIDFESAPGHAYTVTVQSSDGTLTSSQAFTINVGDVAMTTPVDSDGAANSVAEGAANGTAVGITASAGDPNGPATTYALTNDAGGRFTINSTTGVVTVANGAAIDFETAPGHAYGITVQATSGAQTTSQAFSIGVTDVGPSTPTDGNATGNSVFEGAANGTAVGITASSTDPGGGPAPTYALTDSAGGRFAINAATGVVTVANGAAIDYETAPGPSHTYNITVQATAGALSNTQTFAIAVGNVNEAPAGTDKTVTTAEDNAYTFSVADFGFSDPSDSSAPNSLQAVKMTTVPGAGTGTFTNNGVTVNAGDSVLATDIAAGHLVFTPALNASGSPEASFTFQVRDNGGTANGGVDLDQSPNTVNINVTAVNDAPVNSVPGTQGVNEDATLTFSSGAGNAITISDVDVGAGNETVTLSVTSGTLALGSTAGLVPGFTNNAASITLSGTVANINAAMNGLTYHGNLNFNGTDTLVVSTNDNGNTGSGGAKIDSDNVTINVTSVNDAPAGTDKTVTTAEDNAYTFGVADFGFSDPADSPAPNSLLAVKMTTVPGAGTGTFTNNGVTVNAGDSVLATDIAAGHLVFTPALNASGSPEASFTFQVRDNGGTANGGVDLDQSPNTLTINVTAVNDAPVNSVPGTQGVNEDATLTFSSGAGNAMTISDVDVGAGNETVTLTVTSGTLSLGSTAGLVPGFTNNAASITLSGTVANINAAMNGLTYHGNLNFNGADTLVVSTNDNGNTGSGGSQIDTDDVTINVTSVNDAPAGTDKTVTMLEGDSYTFSVADFGFTDPNDSPANSLLAVKMTTVPGAGTGTFTNNGVTVNAGDSVSATNIADGLLVFTPAAHSNGAPEASFTFQVQDNGGIANGGVDLDQSANTVNINVNAVNDAPVNSVPLGTQSVNEEAILTFSSGGGNPITISDIDVGSGNETVTLTVTSGTLSLGSTAGLVAGFTNNAASITLSGTVANINAALDGLTYTGNVDFHGNDTLVVSTNDNGNTGAGGPKIDTDNVSITVNDVADTPSVTNATTNEDTQSASGLVVSRNATDGTDVAFFKITGIANGTLFQNDGTTVINDGDFITFAQANAGLKFTPAADFDGDGTFNVQASTTNSNAGLGGSLATATITVDPVADTPSVTNATTNEDTQSASGLVVTRNAVDGAEVDFVKITNISHGTLFLNDGTTPVNDGDFISIADANAGLKFTPAADFFGNGSFDVQASIGNTDAGLGGAVQTATITVNPVADTPSVTNATTNEDTQSSSGLVVTHNAVDGAEVGFVKITGITNGTLFQNDGTTAINNGDFITYAQANAGLKFTPAADFNGDGSFDVQASLSNTDAGLGGGVQTATITVDPVNDAPALTATGNNPNYIGSPVDLFSAVTASTGPANESTQLLSKLVLTVTNISGTANDFLTIDGTQVNLTDLNDLTTGGPLGVHATVSLAGSTATVTLTSAGLSDTDMQSLVDGMSYTDVTAPGAVSRVVTLTSVQDNGGGTAPNVDTTTLAITSTVSFDAAPTITGGATLNYVENAAATQVDNTIVVNDTDDSDLESATVKITSGFASGQDVLNAVTAGTSIVASFSGDTLTLTGHDTLAHYQTVLRSVTYQNTSDDPSGTDRVLTTTVNDGTLDSTSITSTVHVAPRNDEPTLSATGLNPGFTEQGSPASLFSGANASTIEAGQNLDQIVLTVTNVAGTGASESLLIDGTTVALSNGNSQTTATHGLTASVALAAGTATITVSGGAISSADVNTLVNALAYGNSSDDPGNASRVVSVTSLRDTGANGGGDDNINTALNVHSTVAVTPVNDAPTLTATSVGGTFTEPSGTGVTAPTGSAVDLFSTPHASTVEAGQAFTQIVVTVSNILDTTEFLNVSGTAVDLVNGNSEAVTGGIASVAIAGGTATVTINATTTFTQAQVESLVDSLAYDNNDDTPTATSHTVTITSLTDNGGTANGGTPTASLGLSASVTVVATNDAPTAASFNFAASSANDAIGNTSLVLDDTSVAGAPDPAGPQKTINGSLLTGATDVDGPGPLVTVAQNNVATAHGHVTVNTSGEFSYTPNAGYIGTDTFNYQVSDQNPGTPGLDTGTVTVNVATPKVWYVNADAATDGDGTSAHPFSNLSHFAGAGGVDGAGDTIFLYNTTTNHYTGGLTLENNEKLIGQSQGLTVNGTALEAATGSNSSTIIEGGVVLGSGDTISGVTLGNTTAGTALAGTGFGTLNVDHTAVNTNNNGMILTNGAFGAGAAFTSFTSSGPIDVSLTNVTGSVDFGTGSMGGQFIVNGGTVSTTYSGNLSQATNAAMLDVSGGHSGTLTFQTGTLNATNGTGLQFNNADGTYNFNGTTALNGGDAGVDILNGSAGTFSFSSNTSITNPAGTAFNEDSSAANVTYNGTISQSTAHTAVSATSNTGGTLDFNGMVTASTSTVTGVSITSNSNTAVQFDGGLNIDTTTGLGFNAAGSGTTTIRVAATSGDESINSTTGQALNLAGVVIGTGGLNFDSTISGGGTNNIKLQSVTGNAVSLGTGSLSSATGSAFLVGDGAGGASTGGSTAISYSGVIAASNAASVVNIQDHSTGAVTLSGRLDHSGTSGAGIVMDDNSSDFTFSGSPKDLNTGASAAIAISDQGSGTTVTFSGPLNIDTTTGTGVSLTGTNTGANFNFSGGNLTIDTTTAGGQGFVASGGGTVTVTGSGNHIATTTGTALNVNNTTIGGSGVTFHDISAGNASGGPVKGISLINAGSGGLTVTGTGTTDGSGGTIQDAAAGSTMLRGIEVINTNNISLSNMALTNADRVQGAVSDGTFGGNENTDENGAIHLQTVSNVSLNNIDINGSVQHGINGNNVTNLDIANSTIQNTGNAVWESGIYIFNLKGTSAAGTDNTISGTTISHTGQFNLFVQNNSATNAAGSPANYAAVNRTAMDQLTLSGDTLQDSGVSLFGDNATIISNNGGNLRTVVTNTTFTGTVGGAFGTSDNIQVDASGTGHADTDISGSTFSGGGQSAINISGAGTGFHTFNVHDNTSISVRAGVGVNVAGNGDATMRGFIQDNPHIFSTVPNNPASGIQVFSELTGQTVAVVDNNVIETQSGSPSNGFQVGIKAYARGTGELDLTAINNTVNVSTTNGFEGITVDSGNSTGGEAAIVRLKLANNSIDGQNGADDYVFTQYANDTFSIEGLVGSGTNAANVAAFVASTDTDPSATDPTVNVQGGLVVNYTAAATPQPLLAAAGGVQASSPTPGETHLTQAQLDSVVAAAIAQWAAAGASAAQLAALAAIVFTVDELSGNVMGEQTPGHIVVDTDAAGHGWFVDPTPNDNSEFTHAANAAGTDLYTDPSNAAAGHLDLLTAVSHEMGHELGLDDVTDTSAAHDLMFIDLVDGERRLPDATDVVEASAAGALQAEVDLPASAQAAAGTPMIVGTAGNDTINAGHGGNILFGGGGADNFVFGPATPLDAPTPAQVTHVADYHAAEGDSFDFSAITSAFHNSSVNDSLVVRAVEDASGKFATLQVDHIDPMGLPSAPNWVNVAQLDGAHAGDAVNVLIDNHSVHLAQIHVDLLV